VGVLCGGCLLACLLACFGLLMKMGVAPKMDFLDLSKSI
jgi:hypothetical protein